MRCLGTSPTFNEVDRHLQVHKIGKDAHHKKLVDTHYTLSLQHAFISRMAHNQTGENVFYVVENGCGHICN